jgi:hypothetical protein
LQFCCFRSYVLVPPNTAATKSNRGGEKSWQSARCFLLPQASGSNRDFHCSGIWFWSEGRVSASLTVMIRFTALIQPVCFYTYQ